MRNKIALLTLALAGLLIISGLVAFAASLYVMDRGSPSVVLTSDTLANSDQVAITDDTDDGEASPDLTARHTTCQKRFEWYEEHLNY